MPTAAWDAPALVQALGRAGWSDLDGRPGGGLRSCLHALVSLLPHGSAEGRATAAQIADAAGLSVRWTRRCLHRLEEAGLIIWRRGMIIDGRPRPGWIRVVKTNLARLVRRARGHLDHRRDQRRKATPERLAQLRYTTIRNRFPLSHRAELSAALPFLKGGTRGVTGPPPPPQLPLGDEMTTPTTPCRICNKIPELCQRAMDLVPTEQRHSYEPGRSQVHQIVAPVSRRRTPDRRLAPAGWRASIRNHQDPLIGDQP